MGRKKCQDPAICPYCKYDFGTESDTRYRNLKRHIETVHSGGTTVNNNNIVNIVINNNFFMTNLPPADILKLLTPEVKQKIEELLAANDPDASLLLFRKIRCNPEHPENMTAIIPNVSKNEIKYIIEGHLKTEKLEVGLPEILYSFVNYDVPKAADTIFEDDEISKIAMKQNLVQLDDNSLLVELKKIRYELANVPTNVKRVVDNHMKTFKEFQGGLEMSPPGKEYVTS